YGVVTDPSGRIAALYRPFHLIGLELNVSILSAALRHEATGAPTAFRGDAVAVAKRNLRAGEILDGEGGSCAWGKLMPASASVELGGLPIGLANRLALARNVAKGSAVTWADVRIDPTDPIYRFRRDMEGSDQKIHQLVIPAQAGIHGASSTE
ncbi:MAG: SAF domain-containing protein, partial [Acetobacteraceae bacterium]